LQFGLGEGDILELIKNYKTSGNQVDIMKFKDDLNDNLRDTPEFYVELRSVLNKLVEARVVDNIEEDIPQGKMPKVDAKT